MLSEAEVKEKRRGYARAYRSRNRERVAAYMAKYRQENKERFNGYNRKYRVENREKLRQESRKNRVEEPWRWLYYWARSRARRKCWEFDLDIEWVRSRYTGKCEVTGIPFKNSCSSGPDVFSASIDRVDPKVGYLKSNCRIVLNAFNAMKGGGTDADVFRVAEAILKGMTVATESEGVSSW